jgi:hypothetical protein
VEVLPVRAQVENGIPHELAGAMVGHVPSPAHIEQLDAFGLQLRWTEEKVLFLGRRTQGNHVGVFQKEELVRDLTRPSPPHQCLLKGQPLPVRDGPEDPHL